jgi:hypothetical protein
MNIREKGMHEIWGPIEGPQILDIYWQHNNGKCAEGMCYGCQKVNRDADRAKIENDPTFERRYKYWLSHSTDEYEQWEARTYTAMLSARKKDK